MEENPAHRGAVLVGRGLETAQTLVQAGTVGKAEDAQPKERALGEAQWEAPQNGNGFSPIHMWLECSEGSCYGLGLDVPPKPHVVT